MQIQKLRKSASMVIVRQANNTLEFLLLMRKAGLSFAKGCVFPGGVCDPADLIHNNKEFVEYGKVTAIRETFEETGLLMLPEESRVQDVEFTVGDSTHQLVNRCWDAERLKRILPVMRMLTLQNSKVKRYDTFFYVAGPDVKVVNFDQYLKQSMKLETLQNLDKLTMDRESNGFIWKTAIQTLQAYHKQQLILYPPQAVILGCLKNIHDLKTLYNLLGQIDDVSPLLITFERKEGLSLLPPDYRYDRQKILKKQPESESKRELAACLDQYKDTHLVSQYRMGVMGPFNVSSTTGKTNIYSIVQKTNNPRPKL